jgi:lauroyl/myristoyl acyltransferase
METSIEQLINSPAALEFAAFIARSTPPRLGYSIADLTARWLSSRRDSVPVKAVRSNHQVIMEEEGPSELLEETVHTIFRNSAHSIYELYHYLKNPRATNKLFVIDPSFQVIVDRPEFDKSGLVVAGLHMAGFDLALQWLCMNQFKPLVLTIPHPAGGRRMEFETRQRSGVNLIPGSMQGLLRAVRHLQHGGIALTGIDRPVPDGDLHPQFFGYPSALPTHHIFMALKTHVPVVVVSTRLGMDGKYHIHASPPIEMDPYPDRREELLRNAEKVLAVVEDFIRQDPKQWLIFLQVWPGIIEDVKDKNKTRLP